MSWIQTYRGQAYDFAGPSQDAIDVVSIAHALSNLCRFGGHCSRFYSVAEHSVHVSRVVPAEFAMQGLMHDATEAFVIDVPRPLKHMLAGYAEIEATAWRAIALKFSLPYDLDASVKEADNTVLMAEKEALMLPSPRVWDWAAGIEPAAVKIIGYTPAMARALFLNRYNEIKAMQAGYYFE